MKQDRKILLLDDNRDLLQIIQIILKGQGYETVLASSIQEAEQKIRIHNPALILMDVFISDQDGREYCNQLKSSAVTSNIRVILMSGSELNMTMMSRIHADDFMEKPFDYNDLLSRVQRQMFSVQAMA
jgi:two-component system, OmpR family, response regulator VicR